MSAQQNSFEKAAQTESSGFFSDLFGMLAATKKWWLLPIILVLLVLGVLVLLSGTAAAPFIYTLF